MVNIDMEMPKTCQDCRFLFDTLAGGTTYYYCFACECPLNNEHVTTRPDFCPLQEVQND